MDNINIDKFTIDYDINENKIYINSNYDSFTECEIIITDILSGHIAYRYKMHFKNGFKYFILPFQKWYLEYNNYIDYFEGFSISISEDNDLLFKQDLNITPKIKISNFPKIKANPKNNSWQTYREFFFDEIYDHFVFDDINIVIDIGSNDGLFVDLMLNRNVNTIYAIEPDNRSVEFLCEKFKNKNVIISNCALSNYNGISSLATDPSTTCTSKIIKNDYSEDSLKVETITLENYINSNNIENIDLIKMDVEGEEYNIIKDSSEHIINGVKYFIIEMHQLSGDQLTDIINKFKNFDLEFRDHNNYNCIVKLEDCSNTIVTMFAVNKKYKKKVRIKAVHQLLKDERDLDRQIKSIKNIEKLKQYGVEYKKHINKLYDDLPPITLSARPNDVTFEKRPYGLNPPHFGCYESMKMSILSEFDSDLDAILLFEGDAYILDHDILMKKIKEILPIINRNKISYVSFGGKYNLFDGTVLSNNRESINEDFFVCDKIIGCQGIMFTSWFRERLKYLLRTEPWDVTDLYLNTIYEKYNLKMVVSNDPYVVQLDGVSTIDNVYKLYKNFKVNDNENCTN